MTKPTARLTTPAQMAAALPLWLGYVPTESLVVVCCHEPRGRIGLTLRFDLPPPGSEDDLVEEVARRVAAEDATRVLLAVYTDGSGQPLADLLVAELDHLVVTDVLLVRDGRFWSLLCREPACCPAEGTPVDAGRDASAVRLLAAEQVLEGRAVLPDRAALARTLAAPSFLAAEVARQRCEMAAALLADAVEEAGVGVAAEASLAAWAEAVEEWRSPPGRLGDQQAAALAVSLVDTWVRDALADCPRSDVAAMTALLAELCRRTPAPWDAAVCTLYAWVTYCSGAGAEVTIALERALTSDPEHRLAQLLLAALQGQVKPQDLRRVTGRAAREARRAG